MNATDKQKADAAALRAAVAERHDAAAEAAAMGGNVIRHADGTLTLDPNYPVTKPYVRDVKREAQERAAFDAEIAAAHAEAAARALPKAAFAPAPAPTPTPGLAAAEADVQQPKTKR